MNSDERDAHEWAVDPIEAKAFDRAYTNWMLERQGSIRDQMINRENILRYSHGKNFINPTNPDDAPADMQEHTAISEVKFDDIRNNNLDAWVNNLLNLASQMEKSFMGMLFSSVNEATEKSGNVVNAKAAGSFADALIEALGKMEFSVGTNGEISMPTIVLSPEQYQEKIRELDSIPLEKKEQDRRNSEKKDRSCLCP